MMGSWHGFYGGMGGWGWLVWLMGLGFFFGLAVLLVSLLGALA
jgi:hypothetical protein